MSMAEKYIAVWDIPECCDGVECESFSHAVATALDIYSEWIISEQQNWKIRPSDGMPMLTMKQIEDWNNMIGSCSVYIIPADKIDAPDSEDYEYWLPDDMLHEIGWFEYVPSKLEKEGITS